MDFFTWSMLGVMVFGVAVGAFALLPTFLDR